MLLTVARAGRRCNFCVREVRQEASAAPGAYGTRGDQREAENEKRLRTARARHRRCAAAS